MPTVTRRLDGSRDFDTPSNRGSDASHNSSKKPGAVTGSSIIDASWEMGLALSCADEAHGWCDRGPCVSGECASVDEGTDWIVSENEGFYASAWKRERAARRPPSARNQQVAGSSPPAPSRISHFRIVASPGTVYHVLVSPMTALLMTLRRRRMRRSSGASSSRRPVTARATRCATTSGPGHRPDSTSHIETDRRSPIRPACSSSRKARRRRSRPTRRGSYASRSAGSGTGAPPASRLAPRPRPARVKGNPCSVLLTGCLDRMPSSALAG